MSHNSVVPCYAGMKKVLRGTLSTIAAHVLCVNETLFERSIYTVQVDSGGIKTTYKLLNNLYLQKHNLSSVRYLGHIIYHDRLGLLRRSDSHVGTRCTSFSSKAAHTQCDFTCFMWPNHNCIQEVLQAEL